MWPFDRFAASTLADRQGYLTGFRPLYTCGETYYSTMGLTLASVLQRSLIKAGTSLPAEGSQVFTTSIANQKLIMFQVCWLSTVAPLFDVPDSSVNIPQPATKSASQVGTILSHLLMSLSLPSMA